MYNHKVYNKFPGEEYGKHEYDINIEDTKNGIKYILKRSNSEHWSEDNRGKTACAIIDTSDGFILSKHIKNRELDYALAAELFILMSFINEHQSNSLFKGDIETSSIIKSFSL